MNTTLSLLRDFLAARQDQQTKKGEFLAKHIGEDGYAEANTAFRRADDRYEELFEQVVQALQSAQTEDTTDEVVDALGTQEATALHSLLSDRGLHTLLEANADNGLAVLICKYRKASALYTAARTLNSFRRQIAPEDFEELLGQAPAGVDNDAWDKVVKLLGSAEEEVEAEDAELEPEDITREAAYRVETKTRKRYDELTEKVVSVFRDLMDNGRFDLAVSELEPDERRAAYELQRQVPQPMRQTETKPEARPVDVIG
jgi:hypothetical protein